MIYAVLNAFAIIHSRRLLKLVPSVRLPKASCVKNSCGLCYDQPHFIQVFTMMQPHGQLLCFILLHISNSSVNISLVGHVPYSADLMSAICFPHSFLMIHRYIYSRYSLVFLMLYQLYHSLPSSTLISSSSLYLSVAMWVTPQGRNSLPVVAQNLSLGSFIIYRFLAHGLRASFLVLGLKTLLINAMSTSPQ